MRSCDVLFGIWRTGASRRVCIGLCELYIRRMRCNPASRLMLFLGHRLDLTAWSAGISFLDDIDGEGLDRELGRMEAEGLVLY